LPPLFTNDFFVDFSECWIEVFDQFFGFFCQLLCVQFRTSIFIDEVALELEVVKFAYKFFDCCPKALRSKSYLVRTYWESLHQRHELLPI
jgi:hypothetical protein